MKEHSRIEYNLAKIEELNSELEHNKLQSAYLVIREDIDCMVCHPKLGHKKIRIYPHGTASHIRCAMNQSECRRQ
jgi:Vacuolar sorting protein 39 domain 2